MQIPKLGEEEALVAFTDGLSDKFRYEVVKQKCKTITEAIECVTEYEYCNTGGTEETADTIEKACKWKSTIELQVAIRSLGTEKDFKEGPLITITGRFDEENLYSPK